MSLTTFLATANITLFLVAAGTAVWSMPGASGPVAAGKAAKVLLGCVYAAGIAADAMWLTSDEWRTVARWLGLVSIPAVWIFPDVAGMWWRRRTVQRIEEVTTRVLGGTVDE